MPKLVRTKVIEMDGVKVTIAPLTLDQIEEYVAPLEDIEQAGGNAKVRSYDLVCHGLNNAIPKDSAEQPWTNTSLRTDMDLPLFNRLRDEILKFSGFVVADEKVAVPGESSAAVAGDKSPSVVPESLPSSTSGISAVA